MTSLSLDNKMKPFFKSANPDNYLFRLTGRSLIPEEKGLWTWIKTTILFRDQYRFQNIITSITQSSAITEGACFASATSIISLEGHLRGRIAAYTKRHPSFEIPLDFLTPFEKSLSKNPIISDRSLQWISSKVSLSFPYSIGHYMTLFLQAAKKRDLKQLNARLNTCLKKAINPSQITVLEENIQKVSEVTNCRFPNQPQ